MLEILRILFKYRDEIPAVLTILSNISLSAHRIFDKTSKLLVEYKCGKAITEDDLEDIFKDASKLLSDIIAVKEIAEDIMKKEAEK